MTQTPLIAGVELGGTKCIAILATGPDDIRDTVRIRTTTPQETLGELVATLDRWQGFDAIGIGSFGPVGVDRGARDYGMITTTPKPGWMHTDLVGPLKERYGVPVGFNTDVAGAALSEGRWGAAQGLNDHAYVTVGTGIGVGLVAGGRPLTGMTHAELGHIRPARLRGDDWAGSCPFHGDCVEGLASGTSIAARTGTRAPELPLDHPAWEKVSHALGQMIHTLALTGVPRRIVMGGGVMVGMPHLFGLIRRQARDSINGYVVTPELEDMENYIVPARLGGNAGPLGAVVLGMQAHSDGV